MTIRLYTDGSCKGNPGPASFAWVYVNDNNLIISENNGPVPTDKGERNNETNIRAEIYAIINALTHFDRRLDMTTKESLNIITDSALCIGALTENWKIVKNVILVEIMKSLLLNIRQKRNVYFTKVEGHSGNYWNEYVDKKAKGVLGIK